MRLTKPIPDPVTGKKNRSIPGISCHSGRRLYRIRWRQGSKWIDEYFPVTPRGLEDAIRRRRRIDGAATPLISAQTPDEALAELRTVTEGFCDPEDLTPEVVAEWSRAASAKDQKALLIGLGVPKDHLDDNPDILTSLMPRGRQKVNPQWVQAVPIQKRPRAIAEALHLPVSHTAPLGDTDHPNGERLTVQQVGERYREWYARDRLNVEDAARQAEAYNQVYKPKRPRTWLHYVPRKVRQHYREHLKYFAYFTEFVGKKKTIDVLIGADFRDYYNHVRALAHAKAKPRTKGHALTNPDRWINLRLWAVSGAFRRVKKLYPEAAWCRGLFGEDGLLAILEQRNTGKEGSQVRITPPEFKALLDVADTQWRAILKLGINCALKNSDMMLPWSAIDFSNKLMIYPRPKNQRKRITPLAPETLEALKAWQKETKSHRSEIFVTPDGGPWVSTTDSLGKHWNILRDRVREKTGHQIPATFASLRKSPGPLFLAKQVPNAKEAIQFLLGQKPHEAWRHYVGVAPDCLYPAVEVIRAAYLME